MRDQDRIDEILEQIARVWKNNPDQRLTQLIANVTRDASGAVLGCTDMWNIEDTALLNMLKDCDV